jgi:crossover junction endodeoxyribonuclease RuvC
MRLLGVDPGLSGALALVDGDELVDVYDIESADSRLMVAPLLNVLAHWEPELAVIERVGPMPRQGLSTTWKFARAYGCVEGVIEATRIPCHEITPAVWKRRVGVSADKRSSRAEACRRWPMRADWFARSKDAGRAEAALMVVAWCHSVQHSAT